MDELREHRETRKCFQNQNQNELKLLQEKKPACKTKNKRFKGVSEPKSPKINPSNDTMKLRPRLRQISVCKNSINDRIYLYNRLAEFILLLAPFEKERKERRKEK